MGEMEVTQEWEQGGRENEQETSLEQETQIGGNSDRDKGEQRVGTTERGEQAKNRIIIREYFLNSWVFYQK